MKLTKATFKNFRLLRDIELDFSTEDKKPLTVLRGENESGKTTILTAIQWALYGEKALPEMRGGREYRLHPIDWDFKNDNRVRIEAIVEFQHDFYTPKSDGSFRTNTKKFRLIRETIEEVKGTNFTRRPSTCALFELLPNGDSEINPAEPELNEMLPPELREVFFTDGDRALSFIEATVSTKRQRVEKAIRSLLGLGILEEAGKHVDKAAIDLNRKAQDASSSDDLSRCISRIEEIDKQLSSLEPELDELDEKESLIQLQLKETDKQIDAILRKGDVEELRRKLNANKRNIEELEKAETRFEKKHIELFKEKALAVGLIIPQLKDARKILDNLKKRGTIPKSTVPVLEDRLELETCICGESLKPDTKEGAKRKKYLENLILEHKDSDQLSESLTRLHYASKDYPPVSDVEPSWLQMYKEVFENRDEVQEKLDKAQKEAKALEIKLDELKDTDIQELREKKRLLEGQKEDIIRNHESAKIRISSFKREKRELENQRDMILRKQQRHVRLVSELEAIKDIQDIIHATYQVILDGELRNVSDTMNEYFLKMIVAEPEQRAIIQRASITPEFDIIVYGPDERLLDPDRDLNGASRRALTVSFILALTQVSQVIAPNVIDTPLGMTSGHVKRSILRTAIENSSQLILFLTRTEIGGCGDIIDESASRILTITNSSHYPKMLQNDPGISENQVIRCDCDHHHVCEICERLDDRSNDELAFRKS